MSCPRETVLHHLSNLAPLRFAQSWDNVGLLVDPGGVTEFHKAFLTIDLGEETLEEALEWGADLILSYHPPIFSGLKRLRADQNSERLIVRAIREGVTIYSPHTALDAVVGGMNDWLASALGAGKSRPIIPEESDDQAGAGRFLELEAPLSLSQATERLKKHLGLAHLRLSEAPGAKAVRTAAVCPGAGGSLFEEVGEVDLLVTGEMRHHDILARRARGTHVIVTDHTNTERGFLPTFAEQVEKGCPGLSTRVSKTDRDPLSVC